MIEPKNAPLEILHRWLDEAEDAQAPTPRAMTLVTSTRGGRPSARIVSLKRLEDDALVFTTALWTRKAKE
ncbi:MAG: pyridoxamine 5'-phosphate oxidase family protein, partial [Trebonia sp.]